MTLRVIQSKEKLKTSILILSWPKEVLFMVRGKCSITLYDATTVFS